MPHLLLSSAALAPAMLLAGCSVGGLSQREMYGHTQGAYLAAMYADLHTARARSTEPATFRAPASIAVAQVGEIAPPASMVNVLRARTDVFSRVEVIPAVPGTSSRWTPDGAMRSDPAEQIRALRSIAGSLGVDYLLLVGGTVDRTDGATPLSMFDLTIVGAFVVPGHRSTALMKASGALIDVQTGQVICISSAETTDDQRRPLASSEGDMALRIAAMRDRVTADLAVTVADDCLVAATRTARVSRATPMFEPTPVAADGSATPTVSTRRFQGR